MAACGISVEDLYRSVMDDVIAEVKEDFLNEHVDIDVLQQLREDWESRVAESGCVNWNNHKGYSHESTVQHPVQPLHCPPVTHEHANRSNTNEKIEVHQIDGPPPHMKFSDPGTSRALTEKPLMKASKKRSRRLVQLDGPGVLGDSSDSSSESDEDLIVEKDSGEGDGSDESCDSNLSSLDSRDDLSDDQMADTDDVVMCQYEAVKRVKNHWTLHLKDGIMHLNGKDHAFSVANGTADW